MLGIRNSPMRTRRPRDGDDVFGASIGTVPLVPLLPPHNADNNNNNNDKQMKGSLEIRIDRSSSPRVVSPTASPLKHSSPVPSVNVMASTLNQSNSSIATLSVISQSNSRRRRNRSIANADNITAEVRQNLMNFERRYFDKDNRPVENFKKAVKLVQILLTICEIGYETRSKDELQLARYFTFTEYAAREEDEHIRRSDLSFDAKLFRANKEMRLSTETKAILRKPPNERNNQQLAKVLFSLRSIQSFAEYPVRMQKKLIKVGWYEGHSSQRVILRQGHPPQAFYFVLSGSAVVKIVDRQQNVARTIVFLKRGDSFGELALLHDTRRQSTVISREQIELLCISKEDFIDIFMAAGGVKNINDPDHAEFISSLEFLQGWPTEELPKYPKKFLFHFFRRGAVLVRDSNFSDWIYVVKSGSCKVLKKLKKVVSQVKLNSKLKEPDSGRNSILSVDKLHDLSVSMAQKRRNHVLDHQAHVINTVASAQEHTTRTAQCDVSTRDRETLLPIGTNHHMHISLRQTRGNPALNNTPEKNNRLPRRSLPAQFESPNVVAARRCNSDTMIDVDDPDSVNGRQNRPQYAASPKLTARANRDCSPESRNSISMNPKRHRNNHFYIQTPEPTPNEKIKRGGSPQQKLAIIDEAAKKHAEFKSFFDVTILTCVSNCSAELTEEDIDPCFVQVAVLQKGDVFGLQSIFCDNQPSLSLVSNGAECIMVQKKFYLEHCPETLKARLRKKVSPYPDHFELQNSLQEKINWDHFKTQTLQDAVRNCRTLRRIKAQSII
eukprot:gene8979-9937_t